MKKLTAAKAKKRRLAFEKRTYVPMHADWWDMGYHGHAALPDDLKEIDDALLIVLRYLRRVAAELEEG